MSCQACGTHMSMETYQNYPWMPKQAESKERFENATPAQDCKKAMTHCLYTAQGMFVCEKEVGEKPLVPNEDMARWGADQKGAAVGAAPWAFKQ